MTEFAAAKERILANIKGADAKFASYMEILPLSRAWVSYYWPLATGNAAQALLAGARLSDFEAGVSWSTGVNRGAAASLRTYTENTCAWLHYKDHHIEFGVLSRGEEDLMLPKAVIGYLQKIDKNYQLAHASLFKVATRPTDYYYSNLSEFVHARPGFSLLSTNVAEATISSPPDASFLSICSHVDEFISDVYAAYARKNWAFIPEPVKANLSERLGTKLGKFLAL